MKVRDLMNRGLNLDRLRAFLSVIRAGAVTTAAEGDSNRRSLMSRQIGELETALGFPLFKRQGRKLEPTAEGRELALTAAAFFQEIESLTERAVAGNRRIVVGAGASVFEEVVFPRIRLLEREWPGVGLEFVTCSTSGLATALSTGDAEIGIVRSDAGATGFVSKRCGSMSFVLVGRRDFDSKLPAWDLPQFLRRVPLTCIRGNGQLVTGLLKLARDLDLEVTFASRVETFGHVRDLLMAGAPAGILPRGLAGSLPAETFFVLDDELLRGLDRPLDVVIDARMARVRDRLERDAGRLAAILSGEG